MSLVGPGEFSVESSSCSHLQSLHFLTTLHTVDALIHQRWETPPTTGGEKLVDYLNFSKSQFPHMQSEGGNT